jgi:hypothetical protein
MNPERGVIRWALSTVASPEKSENQYLSISAISSSNGMFVAFF